MGLLAVSLGVLYQALARAKSPFPTHHLATEPPLLAGQWQRTSDDWLAVVCTIQIHRLKWFAWNLAPLVETRW